MSYFLDPPEERERRVGKSIAPPAGPEFLSASNYYLARGDDQRVIATAGLLMPATGPIVNVYMQSTYLA